jgi:class 3 adenylate cyclase
MPVSCSRVLIVDDEEIYRRNLQMSLAISRPDWIFHTASNENEGLQVLQSSLASGENISVVITDLWMISDQGGLFLLREARKHDPWLQVILYSRDSTRLEQAGAIAKGAFEVINLSQLGKNAFDEILLKADAALHYRDVTRLLNLARAHFSPRHLQAVEKNPRLLEPREQTITICFWDIRNYTAFSESHKADRTLVAEFVKEHTQAARQIIFDHDGMFDKSVGDGIMAIFGILEIERGDEGVQKAAVNAVNAALELKSAFKALLKRWQKRIETSAANTVDIKLGCGIHTGMSFFDNIGTIHREHITALGHPVNVASRLQNQSEKGQIIVSRSTRSWVASDFRIRQLRIIDDVKGLSGDYSLHEVTGRRTPRNRAEEGGPPQDEV